MILTVTLNAALDKRYEIDSLRPGEVMRVRNVTQTAGGKGINVSRVAAQLGERVTATGFVGGRQWELFETLITEPQIRQAFIKTASETRCCINIWDCAARKSTELLEPGSPVTVRELDDFRRLYGELLNECQCAVLSGSLPAGAPQELYAELITMAHEAGKTVLLDTSGAALKSALPSLPDFIKPNLDELRQLTGASIRSERELMEEACRLHESGIAYVAVSQGKDGVLVVGNEGVYRGYTPHISVVNTVGCGDSMVAGFATAFSGNIGLREATRRAVAVSAANALTQKTGSFELNDYERLLTQVRVEKIK